MGSFEKKWNKIQIYLIYKNTGKVQKMQHSEISRKHRRKRKSQNDIMSKIFHNHPNKKKNEPAEAQFGGF